MPVNDYTRYDEFGDAISPNDYDDYETYRTEEEDY